MPNGVIGNTTDSGSVKSRFEPWLGNVNVKALRIRCLNFFCKFMLNLFNNFLSLHLTIFRNRKIPIKICK